MKFFMGKEESELSEGDLPDVPEEEPVDRPAFYEYMVQTPDEGKLKFSAFQITVMTLNCSKLKIMINALVWER